MIKKVNERSTYGIGQGSGHEFCVRDGTMESEEQAKRKRW
jgi:hypothetical protein